MSAEDPAERDAATMLVIIWHLLTNDCDDDDLGGDYCVQRDVDNQRRRAIRQLEAFDHKVTLDAA